MQKNKSVGAVLADRMVALKSEHIRLELEIEIYREALLRIANYIGGENPRLTAAKSLDEAAQLNTTPAFKKPDDQKRESC